MQFRLRQETAQSHTSEISTLANLPPNNTDLVIRALEIRAYANNAARGAFLYASHEISFEQTTESQFRVNLMDDQSKTIDSMAQIKFSTSASGVSKLPIVLDVDLVLGDFQDYGLYVKGGRLVLKLGHDATTVGARHRKRFPHQPRLRVLPHGHAKAHKLSVWVDSLREDRPAWGFSLENGPAYQFTLGELIEITGVKPDAVISIELWVSKRQLAIRKKA